MIENRIASLQQKHKDLDKRIVVLEAEHAPDKYIVAMKKEKLKVKDEIQKLKRKLDGG